MDQTNSSKATYMAPQSSAMSMRGGRSTVPVHWSEENEGPIEANDAFWEGEEPTTSSSFNLWDEE